MVTPEVAAMAVGAGGTNAAAYGPDTPGAAGAPLDPVSSCAPRERMSRSLELPLGEGERGDPNDAGAAPRPRTSPESVQVARGRVTQRSLAASVRAGTCRRAWDRSIPAGKRHRECLLRGST